MLIAPTTGARLPVDEHPAVVGVDARPPVAIADAERRDPRVARRAEAQSVADRLAGGKVEDAQRARPEAESRDEAGVAVGGPGGLHAVQGEARADRIGEGEQRRQAGHRWR